MERWEINGDILEFDEATHTYWVNGLKCISVTQLLKFQFPNKYKGIKESTLNKAAEKGSWVHECIEMYERYGIEENEIQEFRDYLMLKKLFNFEVTGNEIPVIIKYKDLIVCGRLDLTLKEQEKAGLGDIKCTSTFDKEYLAYQLNLYKLGYEQCYGAKVEFLRGVHLKNGKRKYAEIPINEARVIELLDAYIEAEKIFNTGAEE